MSCRLHTLAAATYSYLLIHAGCVDSSNESNSVVCYSGKKMNCAIVEPHSIRTGAVVALFFALSARALHVVGTALLLRDPTRI